MRTKAVAIPSVLVLALSAALGAAAAEEVPADCGDAGEAPATPPQPGPSSGTAPGNEGATGWSGGTGGSYTGANPQAQMPGSEAEQPETARGLRLEKTAPPEEPC